MEDRNDVTVPMDGELLKEINSQLEYGDSRSAWIRDACRQKLEDDAQAEAGQGANAA